MFQKLTSLKALKPNGMQAARLRITKDSASVAAKKRLLQMKPVLLIPSFYMSMKILLKIFVVLNTKMVFHVLIRLTTH